MTIQREITWIGRNPNENELPVLENIKLYCVGIKFEKFGITFEVKTDNPEFIEEVKKQFPISEEKTENELVVLTKNAIERGLVQTPHIGFYTREPHKAIASGKGYGLFKSLIVGFASAVAQEQGYHPAHASFMRVNGKGIMLTGGHNAGKTTSLMHLMELLKPYSPKILTDDWTLVGEQTNTAHSLEESISFSKAFCEEFDYLGLMPIYERNAVPGIKKVYLHPDGIFGEGTKIHSSLVERVVLLEPVNRQDLIVYPDVEHVVDNIIEGTYHMPDCDPAIVENHRRFWRELLKEVKFVSFDTRHEGNPNQTFRELYEEIK